MKMNTLGKTNIKVSEICFGTLTIGPLQRALTVPDGLRVLTEALDAGINFYDTGHHLRIQYTQPFSLSYHKYSSLSALRF